MHIAHNTTIAQIVVGRLVWCTEMIRHNSLISWFLKKVLCIRSPSEDMQNYFMANHYIPLLGIISKMCVSFDVTEEDKPECKENQNF